MRLFLAKPNIANKIRLGLSLGAGHLLLLLELLYRLNSLEKLRI